jgi:hypothetical protein
LADRFRPCSSTAEPPPCKRGIRVQFLAGALICLFLAGCRTHWLDLEPAGWADTFDDEGNPVKGLGHTPGYELGLRSDGAVVWRKAKR